jgi:hypothetical protein
MPVVDAEIDSLEGDDADDDCDKSDLEIIE